MKDFKVYLFVCVFILLRQILSQSCFLNQYPITLGKSGYDTEYHCVDEMDGQLIAGGSSNAQSFITTNNPTAILVLLDDVLQPSVYTWAREYFTPTSSPYDLQMFGACAFFKVGTTKYIAAINENPIVIVLIKASDGLPIK